MLKRYGCLFDFNDCFAARWQNAFFLERANCVRTEGHSDFLAINYKSFLLEVWLEDTFRATQREADVVAKLLAFTGEFTSCCHSYISTYFLQTLASIPDFFVCVKRADAV